MTEVETEECIVDLLCRICECAKELRAGSKEEAADAASAIAHHADTICLLRFPE